MELSFFEITNELACHSAFFLIPPSTYIEPTKRAPNGQRQPPAAIMSPELSETPTAAGRLDAVLGGVALPTPRGFRLH